jgi:hypothetical protein
MKKKLLSQKILPSLALMLVCFNASFGQQTIGEFSVMDGGFESQTITTINVITPNATDWTISTSPASTTRAIVTDANAARSGSKYASFSNAASGSTRLQSPIASTLAASTQYTVQYYFKAAVSPLAYLTGAVYFNTTGTNAAIVPKPATFVANTWIKASATFTSTATTGTPRFGAPRINGTTNTTDIINVDDFVVYAGPLDETAPDAPSAITVSGLSVSWTAPGTGVDGGGYVVVRYATPPAADNNPKQNGIYKIGNTLTEGTASLAGTIVYVGTNTSFTDAVAGAVSGSDFYKVYAVDKAFNYSSAATLKTNQWSVNNPISVYPNPVKDNQFSISLPASIAGKVAVGIYNISGQLVYKAVVTEASDTIAVRPAQSLKAGVYVVKVDNNGHTSTQKITVR